MTDVVADGRSCTVIWGRNSDGTLWAQADALAGKGYSQGLVICKRLAEGHTLNKFKFRKLQGGDCKEIFEVKAKDDRWLGAHRSTGAKGKFVLVLVAAKKDINVNAACRQASARFAIHDKWASANTA
jgi:hypothetical protein